MCERLPGDRCSHHIRQDVDKKTLKAASIFVASGAASPLEMEGKDKEAYDSAVADLRAAQDELNHTPTEIKKRATEARKARRTGNVAYAEELEESVETSEALRARRKAGLKHLKEAEVQIGKNITKASYRREEAQQAKLEVDSKISAATKGLTGSAKEDAVLRTTKERQAAGRREIARLKKARTQLDKDLSKSVDAGNAARSEVVLEKIQKNIKQISFADQRNQQYAERGAAVTQARNEAAQQSRLAARPVSHDYHSGGCGGGGCGASEDYYAPGVASKAAAPARRASTRQTTPRRPATPRVRTVYEPVYVPYSGGGCGGGGGC